MTTGLDDGELAPRSILSVEDLATDDLRRLVTRGQAYADHAVPIQEVLRGRVVAIYFRKTSTRTRTAFSSAALRLGARIINYGPDDLQTNTGETFRDTGRVLATMVDALVARTAGDPQELRDLASQPTMPVVNAMTADEHPTQAIADLTTMLQHLGRIENLRVLYLGEGNNSASALALALARFPGNRLHLRTPSGYGLAVDKLEQAQARAAASGSLVEESHDAAALPDEIDVVYTTRWQTTGTTKPDADWHDRFEPFQVNEQVMARWPGARFMHDLPAHRGEEVTEGVLDGPCSLALSQAANKYHTALAILEWCIADGERP
jgi:ornithine carbamoyltransferase